MCNYLGGKASYVRLTINVIFTMRSALIIIIIIYKALFKYIGQERIKSNGFETL